ncbi:hypothetical protein [Caulobacter sp. LjRoot300]|uniref:hypothetical protein n=1 Tax=Caulobacter sp. LjRoot300 TaxID=3342321 RepID=UPI003ED0BB1B
MLKIAKVGAKAVLTLAICILFIGAESNRSIPVIAENKTQRRIIVPEADKSIDVSSKEQEAAVRREAREVEDLEAQKSMARSAREMIDLTWLQIALGAVSFLGVLATFIYTRRQVDDARHQLAASVAEHGSQFEIRANSPPHMKVNFLNGGATPALDFMAWGNMDIYPASTPLPRAPTSTVTGTPSPLAPGKDRYIPLTHTRLISLQEETDLRNGVLVLAAQCRASFTDVFGRKRILNVNMMTETATSGTVRLVFY